MQKRIVVIGGVAAGMSAAAKARRTDPDADIASIRTASISLTGVRAAVLHRREDRVGGETLCPDGRGFCAAEHRREAPLPRGRNPPRKQNGTNPRPGRPNIR